MQQYLRIIERILAEGSEKGDRTGNGTLSISGMQFEHDMANGFPLLTTKRMAHKPIRVELEGFLKGITDKRWFQERGCRIWNEWCNPQKVPYGRDEETQKKMFEENDLGPIYGAQWRNFNGQGYDQIQKLVDTLNNDRDSRRMLVSAHNPVQLDQMALEPCHDSFQVLTSGDKMDPQIDLIWRQRSVDVMLGLPFNIASYGLLLHLLAKTTGFKEGRLVGHLGDTHIYQNHVEGAYEQLKREPYNLPRVETDDLDSIFDWTHDMTRFVDYESHPQMKRDEWFPIAV